MLTPLDIHQKEFRKGAWGYKPEEVEEFQRQAAQSFEELYKENLLLKEQVARCEENLSRYRQLEETLNSTLVLAQKTADEQRASAEREAEVRLREAQLQADQIVAAARTKQQEMERQYEHLRNQFRQFRVQFRAMLLSQLESVKGEDWEGMAGMVEPYADARPWSQAAVLDKEEQAG
ncbi:DivIVA domain-containing protein [Heliobacterium gestii]|uniref:DivIVA domain-containing protein n=1 Tax=Heliomicrobium gestii TaxID=2699 RepID=A0A845LH25_HELGE|nr:DivIVA domain-containing protein [Heliomicrobium gestii]MBM7867563.1 cell division initiation protein [Heliomicrobium gestii]MZP43889.1 DivIVA domain-containing protein [Heliomicrobium gestii]